MNIALSDTILYVTGKQGIENTTQQELQTMVAEYPYFAPAQLIFAAKLKSENSFKLQTQIQKTGLFFNNFKWLQYQLIEASIGGFSSNIPTKKQEEIKETKAVEQAVATPIAQPVEVVIEEKEEPVFEAENIVEETTTTDTIPELEQYDIAETIPANIHQFMPNLSIPTVEDVKGIMNGIDEKREDVAEVFIENNFEVAATPETTIESETIETHLNNEVENNVEFKSISFDIDDIETAEIVIAAPANDIHAEIAALKENWYTHNKTNEATEIVEPLAEQEIEQSMQKITSNIESFKNDWDKPLENVANMPLPFETDPYYTIDYFASQGIKFDYTKEPQDKLTVKMLKFTDWLKKMKTPKQETKIIEDDPELDAAIQNIAAASNQSKEIVTETMAEVFAKQGKTDKAIQLYIKLSFLIPNKSAYFATKLNELKGI